MMIRKRRKRQEIKYHWDRFSAYMKHKYYIQFIEKEIEEENEIKPLNFQGFDNWFKSKFLEMKINLGKDSWVKEKARHFINLKWAIFDNGFNRFEQAIIMVYFLDKKLHEKTKKMEKYLK